MARRQKSGVNLFMIIGLTILGMALVAALAVFGYELYLKGAKERKAAELAEAQRAVNLDTVEDFIRLRNRLNAADGLLDQHVTLSSFFDVLEAKTLTSVRFSSLSLSVEDDRTARIEMEGVARSFNALAAQSAALATEKRVKRAIFSDIAVNENGTVGFLLSAEAEPRLVASGAAFAEEATAAPAPANVAPVEAALPRAATSTPAAATTTRTNATSTPAL